MDDDAFERADRAYDKYADQHLDEGDYEGDGWNRADRSIRIWHRLPWYKRWWHWLAG